MDHGGIAARGRGEAESAGAFRFGDADACRPARVAYRVDRADGEYRDVHDQFLDAAGGEGAFELVLEHDGGVAGDDSASGGVDRDGLGLAKLGSQAGTEIPRGDSGGRCGDCSFVVGSYAFSVS